MQNDAYSLHPQAPNDAPEGNGTVPASDANGPEAIGMIASPMRHESTSVRHFFWVPPDKLVEKTQLVRTTSEVAGRTIQYYGLVEEVYRRSRRRDMEGEFDVYDGDLSYEPPFAPEGVTYADVSILRIEPPFLTPPREQSLVYRADEADAYRAYGYDEMRDENGVDWRLPIGLLRNGGDATVGVAHIDLRDLRGDRAGHLNVTGQSGRGTKSSFILLMVRSLLDVARSWDRGDPRRPPFSARVIAFNVKGEDLMFIDQPNRLLIGDKLARWKPLQQLGIAPRPFENAEFVAPCRLSQGPINRGAPRVVRPVAERQTRPYYWTLADVVRLGLWPYLFSDTAQQSEPLMALADHVLGLLAEDGLVSDQHPYGVRLRSSHDAQTFSKLRDWLRKSLRDKEHEASDGGIHTFATKRALLSRLGLVLDQEGRSIFADEIGPGCPLQVLQAGTPDPLVIDIAELPPELRRFVVAAVLEQVKGRRQPEVNLAVAETKAYAAATQQTSEALRRLPPR
jgi:hypothetical protein